MMIDSIFKTVRGIVKLRGGTDNTIIGNGFGASNAGIRVIALPGNVSGLADFGAGTTSAQTLRVVLPTDQTPIPGVGNIAAGSADSGNPVKIGGVYNSTTPTLSTGQRGDIQLTSRGSVTVAGSAAVGVAPINPPVSISGVDGGGLKRSFLTDTGGQLQIASHGPVTPGTVAGKSDLMGGQFNTSFPVLTNGQQAALQLDSSARLVIRPLTSSNDFVSVVQSTSPWIVGGAVAVGLAPTSNPVSVSGVDGGGLKRHILTDTTGRIQVASPFNSATGTLAGNGQTVSVSTTSCSTVQYSTLGTFIGTILTEISYDGGANWFDQSTVDSDPDTNLLLTVWGDNAAGAFNNDSWIVPVAGTTNFRLRVTAYTSGSLAVQIVASAAVSTPINPANDRWGAATIGALNATASGATSGCSTCSVTIAGSWVGTISFQATNDHINYFPVRAYNLTTNLNTLTATANGNYLVSCGGFHLVQAIFTSYSSGSALVTLEASTGSNVNIVQQISGNVNSGTADSGAPVKVGGVYNAILPVVLSGQRVDLQLDSSGRLLTSTVISSLPAATFENQNAINAGVTVNTVFTASQKLALKQFYAGGTGIGKQALFSYNATASAFLTGGDFESASDVGTTWVWTSVSGTGSAAQSTTQAFTGTHSCAVTFTNSSGNNAQSIKQTYATAQDLSTWRYLSAQFFNVLSTGGAYTRTISIILTDTNASTRTYSVSGSSTVAPFSVSGWIQILGELANPTSFTGTSFDMTSIASVTLTMADSGNKAGTVYWDTIKLTSSLVPIFPIYHAANVSFNIAIDPVFTMNIGDTILIAQTNNDATRKEFFATAGGVSTS